MRNRTFIKYSLSIVGAVCFIVASTNYLVDPYGKNNAYVAGFNKIKVIKDERISKFNLLNERPNADSFLFGSSRGLILNPGVVEKLKGGETLNLAFSSATADEYLLYIKYILATRKAKNIIIGIDLFAYAEGFDSTGTLPQELRNYFDMDNNYSIANYFSLKIFKRSIHTINYNLSHDSTEMDDRYTSNGQILVRDYFEAKKSEDEFNKYISHEVIKKPARWATRFDKLNTKRLESLIEIKRLCDEHDVNLYLFMSPLYIKQITMNDSKFPLQQKLLQFIVRHVAPVVDYNNLGPVNTTATNFIDEFHYSYDVADSILAELLTGKAVTEELMGWYVNKSNLNAYIEQVTQRYLNYKHPVDD